MGSGASSRMHRAPLDANPGLGTPLSFSETAHTRQDRPAVDVIVSLTGVKSETKARYGLQNFVLKALPEYFGRESGSDNSPLTCALVESVQDIEDNILLMGSSLMFIPFLEQSCLESDRNAAELALTECEFAQQVLSSESTRLQRVAPILLVDEEAEHWPSPSTWKLACDSSSLGATIDSDTSTGHMDLSKIIMLLSRSVPPIPFTFQQAHKLFRHVLLGLLNRYMLTLNWEPMPDAPEYKHYGHGEARVQFHLNLLPMRIANACRSCMFPPSMSTDVYFICRYEEKDLAGQVANHLRAKDPSVRLFFFEELSTGFLATADDRTRNAITYVEMMGVDVGLTSAKRIIQSRIALVFLSESSPRRVQNQHLDTMMRELDIALDSDRQGYTQIVPIKLPGADEAFKRRKEDPSDTVFHSVCIPTRLVSIASAKSAGRTLLPWTQTASACNILTDVFENQHPLYVSSPSRQNENAPLRLDQKDLEEVSCRVLELLKAWRRSMSTVQLPAASSGQSRGGSSTAVVTAPCRFHRVHSHDFFLSHRQRTEGLVHPGNAFILHLFNLLDAKQLDSHRETTAFWDVRCINVGHQFQDEFVSHIRRSRVIVLIISYEMAKDICNQAAVSEDNVFLEWELALEALQSKSSEIVVIRVGNDDRIFQIAKSAPDCYHASQKSASLIPSRMTIKKTIEQLFFLNFQSVVPEPAGFEGWETAAKVCFEKLRDSIARRSWQAV